MSLVPRLRPHRLLAAGGTAVLLARASCGGDDDSGGEGGDGGGGEVELSAEAQAGRDLARQNGCAGCHGDDFSGSLGPSWVGLYGSEVELEGGQTVTADEAYLTRAIADPGAERVAGFALEMPGNDLSDEEIAQVVAYIKELGG